jgi:hypothetical protein
VTTAERVLRRFAAQNYGRRIAHADRPKYPDGRLIPQPGDVVYQAVRGFGGLPASIVGVISPSGKTVKVTGGSDLLGGRPSAKTYKMSPHWTVRDDPSVKAREEARKQKEAEAEAKKKLYAQRSSEIVEAEGHKRGLHRIKHYTDVKPGDKVYAISAYDPSYDLDNPDPTKLKLYIQEETVHDLSPRWKGFTYLNEHGSESTSGNPDLWWTH